MKILLTGATGFIGTTLCEKLLHGGHELNILSRKKQTDTNKKKYFTWNPEKNQIDTNAFAGAEAIINLAGANVADKKWTKQYKEEILQSRILSTKLLVEHLKRESTQINVFINASATGIYGNLSGNELLDEHSEPANDFLATVVKAWEEELSTLPESLRKIILRLGIVLSDKGGALPKLAAPVKYGMGAPLASGKQYISWISLEDVINTFVFSLEEKNVQGVYNLVASEPVTNEELTKRIAAKIKKPLILPNIPAFVLKVILGEFAESLTGGSRISNRKLIASGYQFYHPDLDSCLNKYLS